MNTNDTNNANNMNNANGKVIYPELSYKITGICFNVHNELGRYAREKQYADKIEKQLKGEGVFYKRELIIGDSNNILDFLIEDKIILELKAKRLLTKEDYYQLQRYLQESGIKLGMLVNFRNRYIKPVRIIRIDTD
jgi:GxxExxY protein